MWKEGPSGLRPALDRRSLALPLVGGDERFQRLARAIQNVAVYAIFPDTLRVPQAYSPSRPMSRHGDNWVSILHDQPEATWKPELVAALQKLTGDMRDMAPEAAGWVRPLKPPFPVAVVLLHREFEVLFLPCVAQMAGRPIVGADGQARPGLVAGSRYDGDWEAKRGVKEWLSERFPRGVRYKPSLDQLPMTRMIDVPTLRAAEVPCFGSLERALRFLAASFGEGGVYPEALV